MRGRLAILAGMIVLGAVAVPAQAADPRSPYLELQRRDQALFVAGWRLVTGNAPFCRTTVPAIGLLLHDRLTYSDPDAAGAALGLRGDIAVQAVAAGSPAARLNVQVGAVVTALGNRAVATAFPPADPSWTRLGALNRAMTADLTRDGAIELAWQLGDQRPAQARIHAVQACPSRFEVTGLGQRAVADGERVVFGDRFPGFDWPEDEFAAAVAHELAHNLLGHRTWLDRAGRSRANVRLTEDEADRLAPWLLANAGYDPAAAVRLLQRWGPDHDGGLLRKSTHARWRDRADAIAAELPLIDRARATAGGKADWTAGFRRTTGG